MWAKTNATLANGVNSYTAVAVDSLGRSDTATVSVTLPATSAFTYDLNGNLLSDGTRYFVYDDENQLLSVTVSNAWQSQYVYDGLNRRRISRDFQWNAGISGWVETNEVRYVYDGNLVIQERDSNNVPSVTYTRGSDFSASLEEAGGIGGLLARTDNHRLLTGDVNSSAYYQSDNNGNVVAMLDFYGQLVAQYAYDPYGNMLSMSGPLAAANKYRFSSKEWNENAGLYYYGYRFYEPSLQRWPNRDPLGESGGINLYSLAANSPLNAVDAFGLCDGIPPGEPGELDAETLEAADSRTASQVAQDKLKQEANQEAKDALGSSRGKATDDLRSALKTGEDESPHHNIPHELNDNPLVKKAAEDGWDVNKANNGTNLPKELHPGFKNINRWHRDYNKIAKQWLNDAWDRDPNMTPAEAAAEAQRLSNQLGKLAKIMCKADE